MQPLADGSSNPSLLENLRQKAQCKTIKDIALTESESPSQMDERDYYYDQRNYSPQDPKAYNEDRMVLIVNFFPEILAYSR